MDPAASSQPGSSCGSGPERFPPVMARLLHDRVTRFPAAHPGSERRPPRHGTPGAFQFALRPAATPGGAPRSALPGTKPRRSKRATGSIPDGTPGNQRIVSAEKGKENVPGIMPGTFPHNPCRGRIPFLKRPRAARASSRLLGVAAGASAGAGVDVVQLVLGEGCSRRRGVDLPALGQHLQRAHDH